MSTILNSIRLSYATMLVIMLTSAAFPCGGPLDVGCNIGDAAKKAVGDVANTGQKAVDDVAATGTKAINDAADAGKKAGDDTLNTARKAVQDIASTAKKAIDDTANSGRKAVDDTARNAAKAVVDVVDAGKAVERFTERQIHGYGDSLSDAEKRVREGKVVDALWHLGTDELKHTDENAAEAAHDSAVLSAAAQGAATFYGGPAGAAAYAAWYTYHETGKVDLALKAGLIAGATSAGYGDASAMQANTVAQVAKKAVVTGALGGLAVAAAGGDDAAVKDAFLKQGAMVLVQSAQAYATKNFVDPQTAKADAFCVSNIGVKCTSIPHSLRRDDAGNYVLVDGNHVFDTSKIVTGRSDLGMWKSAPHYNEGSFLPNAVVTGDGNWAVSWDLNAFTDKSAALPAVALTYVGEGSFVKNRLDVLEGAEEAAANPAVPTVMQNEGVAPAPGIKIAWAAAGSVGGGQSNFEVLVPTEHRETLGVGFVLRSLNDVELRPAPADWKSQIHVLSKGTTVLVSDIQNLGSTPEKKQVWIKVEPVDPGIRVDKISASITNSEQIPSQAAPDQSKSTNIIWCYDKESQIAFQIDSDHNVRGLITKLSGKALLTSKGSYKVSYSQDDIIVPGISIPIKESIKSTVSSDGSLYKPDGGSGKLRKVGMCSAITGLLK